nr:uncharacterized protein LOC122272284 [Parasteatoda tepidariorum]
MKINLTLTIIVLTIVNGFNMSSSSGDIGDGEYFESCIKWIKCKLEDKDALDKYDKCQKLASDETITKMLKIMGDIANREWSDSEAAYNEFCNMDKDQQHEFFIHHLQQMLEEYSVSICNKLILRSKTDKHWLALGCSAEEEEELEK